MSGSTWWSNFHGVTYFEDHSKHENEANESIPWKLYGTCSTRKLFALETALEMAA